MRNGSEEEKATCRSVLYTSLEVGLRLIHPFMPFISEELYQRLPQNSTCKRASIMISPYPEAQQVFNKKLV